MGQSERSESRTNFLQGSVVFRLCNQEASLSAPRRRILKPDCELESAGGLFLSSFQTSNPWTHPGRVTVPLVVWRCSSATCICMDLSWRILMRKPVWEICCRPPPHPSPSHLIENLATHLPSIWLCPHPLPSLAASQQTDKLKFLPSTSETVVLACVLKPSPHSPLKPLTFSSLLIILSAPPL